MADNCAYKIKTKDGEEKEFKDLPALHKYLLSGDVKSEDILSQLKTESNATPEIKIENQESNQQASGEEHRGTGSQRNEKATDETDNRNQRSDGQGTGKEKEVEPHFTTMADTEKERQALGIEGHPMRKKSDTELSQEADKAINEGYSAPHLVDDILSGNKNVVTDTERVILSKYSAELQSKVDSDPSDENIASYASAIRAMDHVGSEAGAALRAIQLGVVKDATLADALFREMDAHGVNVLTDQQKSDVTKEWNDIQEAEKKCNEKAAAMQAENDALRAQLAVKEQAKKVPRGTKKTSEDFSKERKQILSDMKDALKKVNRGEAAMASVPGVPQLVAIAPHVLKLSRSLLEQGYNKFEDVVRELHSQAKEALDGVTEKDIRDILAGEYASNTRTENQLNTQMRDLRTQADLLNRLDKLNQGEELPKTERGKIARNKEIADLQKQIKDKLRLNLEIKKEGKREQLRLKKEAEKEGKPLANYKKRVQQQMDEVQEQLNSGNFVKDKKTAPVVLDKEATDLRNNFIKLKQEREIRLAKAEYAKRTKLQKAGDIAKEVGTLPRALKTAIDFSSVLRHGIVATFSHPQLASKALPEMFKQAFSETRFNRWLYDLRESPEYETMQKSGLRISDPTRPELTAREEAFQSHLLQKIPLLGKYLKGNERAYTSYLNKMRVDMFNQASELLKQKGILFDSEPETYKALATFVNNATGSGSFGEKFDKAVPALNTVFFSPRLLASRLNLMNPVYYAKLPPEVRAMALGDMAKFVAGTSAVIAGMWLAGAKVNLNPLSSDWLKGKFGDLRYDILGGFDSEIKALSQIIRGKKETDTGLKKKENRANLAVSFLRGKLSPSASIGWDVLSGKTATGEKVTLKNEVMNQFPFAIDDTKDTWKDAGVKSILTTALPSMFGVGVQDYKPKSSIRKW